MTDNLLFFDFISNSRYLYYSDGYTFIIEHPSVSGRYFYGTAEDGFEIRLEWVDGRSIRKK